MIDAAPLWASVDIDVATWDSDSHGAVLRWNLRLRDEDSGRVSQVTRWRAVVVPRGNRWVVGMRWEDQYGVMPYVCGRCGVVTFRRRGAAMRWVERHMAPAVRVTQWSLR